MPISHVYVWDKYSRKANLLVYGALIQYLITFQSTNFERV